jgi:hypothetical protein
VKTPDINSFLRALRKTPREIWRITRRWTAVERNQPQLLIRCRSGRCPIEVIGNVPSGDHSEAAHALGMDDGTRLSIVLAADDCGQNGLRLRILKACGLWKPKAKPKQQKASKKRRS